MSWRDSSSDWVRVGRSLEKIEQCLISVRALAAVNDLNALGYLREMRLAAQRLTDTLRQIEFEAREASRRSTQ